MKILIFKSNFQKIFLFLALLILGSFLRFYHLGDNSLWWDEMQTAMRIEKSFASMVYFSYVSTIDPHPPLFDIIVHTFYYLGRNDFVALLPSAILGVLALIVIYRAGKLFFNDSAGFISMFLLGISITHIYYSRELRGYSLFALTSLLSFYYFYKTLSIGKKKLWIGYIFSTAACLYSHYWFVWVLISELAYITLYTIGMFFIKRKKFKNDILRNTVIPFVTSLCVVFLLYIPWLYPFLHNVKPHLDSNKQGVGIEAIKNVFNDFTISGLRYDGGMPYKWLFLLFLVTGVVGILRCRKIGILTFISIWFCLPFLVLYLIGYKVEVFARHVIFMLPVFILLISNGITELVWIVTMLPSLVLRMISKKTLYQFSQNGIISIWISLILTITLFYPLAMKSLLTIYTSQKSGYQDAARYINENVDKNDFLCSNDLNCWFVVNWYLKPKRENGIPNFPPSSPIGFWWCCPSYSPIYEERYIPKTNAAGLVFMMKNQDVAIFKGTFPKASPVVMDSNKDWVYSADYNMIDKVYRDYYSAENIMLCNGHDALYTTILGRLGSIVYRFKVPDGRKIRVFKIMPHFTIIRPKNYGRFYISSDGINFRLVKTYNYNSGYCSQPPSKDYVINVSHSVKNFRDVYLKFELYADISAGHPFTALLVDFQVEANLCSEDNR